MRRLVGGLLLLAWVAQAAVAEPPAPETPAPATPTKPDAASLAKDLASADLETRRKAVYALWGLAYEATPAMPALAKALADDDDYVRTTAEKVLLKIAPLAMGRPETWTPTFSALRELVKDARLLVRRSAALALWTIGTVPEGAEPLALTGLTLLADEDADLRANGAGILANVAGALTPTLQPLRNKAVVVLVGLAADKDDRVRRAVADALGQLGMPDGMDPLFTLTKDPEAKVRAVALPALGGMPRSTHDLNRMLEIFRAALFDADPEVRASAANTLWALGMSAEEALPDLREALREDPEASVRGPCVAAIGATGVRSALDVVRAAMDDRDEGVRVMAVTALADFGPDAAPHLPLLVHLLRSGGAVGVSASRAIARLGYVATPARPALLKALAGDAPEMRSGALSALYVLTWHDLLPPESVPALLAALSRPDVTASVAHVLAVLPRLPATAGPALCAAFAADASDPGRRALLYALARVEDPAEEALALVRPLAGAGEGVPRLAAYALVTLGTEADRARGLQILMGLLGGADEPNALGLLRDAGPHARAAAPTLAQRFRELGDAPERRGERFLVASALASIGGEHAPEAIEYFRGILVGGDNLTAAASAAEVLGKVEDPPPAVLDALVSRLEDPDAVGDVAVRAAVALRRLGAVDAHTLELLARAAEHPRNGALRLAAGHALLVLAGR